MKDKTKVVRLAMEEAQWVDRLARVMQIRTPVIVTAAVREFRQAMRVKAFRELFLKEFRLGARRVRRAHQLMLKGVV